MLFSSGVCRIAEGRLVYLTARRILADRLAENLFSPRNSFYKGGRPEPHTPQGTLFHGGGTAPPVPQEVTVLQRRKSNMSMLTDPDPTTPALDAVTPPAPPDPELVTREEQIALTQRANLTPEEKIQLAQQRRIATARTRRHRKKIAAQLAQRLEEERQEQADFDQRRMELRLVAPSQIEPFIPATTMQDALQTIREFLRAYELPDVQVGETLTDVERRLWSIWHLDGRLLNRNSGRLSGDRVVVERNFTVETLPSAQDVIDVATLPALPSMLPVPVTVEDLMSQMKLFHGEMERRRMAVNPFLPIDVDPDRLAIEVVVYRSNHEADVVFEYAVKQFWYLDRKYFYFDKNDSSWRERATEVRSYNGAEQELIRQMVTNEMYFTVPAGALPAELPAINYMPSPLNVGYLSSLAKRKREQL
jgi:hypothetical protein